MQHFFPAFYWYHRTGKVSHLNLSSPIPNHGLAQTAGVAAGFVALIIAVSQFLPLRRTRWAGTDASCNLSWTHLAGSMNLRAVHHIRGHHIRGHDIRGTTGNGS